LGGAAPPRKFEVNSNQKDTEISSNAARSPGRARKKGWRRMFQLSYHYPIRDGFGRIWPNFRAHGTRLEPEITRRIVASHAGWMRTVKMAAKPTLGSLMRSMRDRYGLTLKEMSERTGVPFSTLSKVEHDRLTLTYDKLQMISERLGVRMSELFAEPKSEPAAVANSRRSVCTPASALSITTPNYDYFYLSPELRHKDMIPIFTRVKARSLAEFGDMVRHDGQEFLYVLEGRVVVHTEFYDPVTLSAGESVYIDSRMGHAYLADGDCRQALVICVCSTTQEELLDNAASRNLAAGVPAADRAQGRGLSRVPRPQPRRTAPAAAKRNSRTGAHAD
jgi:transcriptional regulator with XRE-family HTH domain